uniref:Uncharacterized protein n=1 Tax=Anguilla anguilla TaxID=7936 RepID=A0A0E9SNF3_ANGAN
MALFPPMSKQKISVNATSSGASKLPEQPFQNADSGCHQALECFRVQLQV